MTTLDTAAIAGAAILVSSCLQSITGFGFAIMAVPMLLFVFPPNIAVLLSTLVSGVMLANQVLRRRKWARWDLIWKMMLSSFPGLFAGFLIQRFLDEASLKGLVGGTLLSYVGWQLIKTYTLQHKPKQIAATPEGHSLSSPPVHKAMGEATDGEHADTKGFRWYFVALAGVLSGFLTGSMGMPGPPVVALLAGRLPKSIFQATTAAYFFFQNVLLLLVYFLLSPGIFASWLGQTFLFLLIPAYAGLWLGFRIERRISESHFTKLVFLMLLVIGISSTWTALRIWFF